MRTSAALALLAALTGALSAAPAQASLRSPGKLHGIALWRLGSADPLQ